MGKISKDKRESSARHLFVGSQIDDAGLTSSEFRVLGRIVRRGICWESIPNMSKSMKIGIRQVRRAINGLVKNKWVTRTDIKGVGIKLEATINKAIPLSDKTGVTPSRSARSPLSDKTGVPLSDRTGKGYTLKDIPKGKKSPLGFEVGKSKRKKQGATEYGW